MEAVPYKTKAGTEQFRPVMSEDEFREEQEAYTGFCLACGNTQGQCEPDAKKYTCEDCGRPKVYGLEELLLMGLLRLNGEGEE